MVVIQSAYVLLFGFSNNRRAKNDIFCGRTWVKNVWLLQYVLILNNYCNSLLIFLPVLNKIHLNSFTTFLFFILSFTKCF